MSTHPVGARNCGPTVEDRAVAARFRAVRLACGVSQIDIGEALGVSFQQIQKYERAANRIPAGRLARAARHLEVDVATFFAGIEEDGAHTNAFRDLLGRPGVSKADVRDLDTYLALPIELRRALGVMFTAFGGGDAERANQAHLAVTRMAGAAR